MTASCKTVGELVSVLSKLDPSTRFARITEGYYCVTKETRADVYAGKFKLEKVENGSVVSIDESDDVDRVIITFS